MMRYGVLGATFLLLFACGGSTEDGSSVGSSAGSRNESPQAAFDAARRALEEKDMAGFVTQLTPQGQEQFAGMLVATVAMMSMMGEAMGGMAQAFGGEKADAGADDAMADVKKLMAKYEIDPQDLDLSGMQGMMGGKKPEPAAMAKLAEGIDDPARFVEEALSVLDRLGNKGPGQAPRIEGDLVDVKVEGDTATGRVETQKGPQPIIFRRIDGNWRLEMPDLH